jgi:hypothetical protein
LAALCFEKGFEANPEFALFVLITGRIAVVAYAIGPSAEVGKNRTV